MEFGVFLPNYGPLATKDGIAKAAEALESLGFDAAVVCDHVFIEPEAGETHINAGAVDAYPPNHSHATWFDALATLAFVSGMTSRLRLVTNIYLLPLRHPLVAARELTTLDVLSGGRLTVGIGVGWFRREFDVLGIPFTKRGQLVDEYLLALKEVWLNPTPSFNGQFVRFDNIHWYPRPVQKPHPPIWIGGYVNDGIKLPGNERTLRRVARIGDGWIPSVASRQELSSGIQLIRTFAREQGRDFAKIRIVSQHMISVDMHEERALAKARTTLVRRFGSLDAGLERNLVGTPSEIVRQLEDYIAVGATDFVFGVISPTQASFLADLKLIATEILPSFSSVPSS